MRPSKYCTQYTKHAMVLGQCPWDRDSKNEIEGGMYHTISRESRQPSRTQGAHQRGFLASPSNECILNLHLRSYGHQARWSPRCNDRRTEANFSKLPEDPAGNPSAAAVAP